MVFLATAAHAVDRLHHIRWQVTFHNSWKRLERKEDWRQWWNKITELPNGLNARLNKSCKQPITSSHLHSSVCNKVVIYRCLIKQYCCYKALLYLVCFFWWRTLSLDRSSFGCGAGQNPPGEKSWTGRRSPGGVYHQPRAATGNRGTDNNPRKHHEECLWRLCIGFFLKKLYLL